MTSLNINGHRIKVRWFETILSLWDMHGNIRRVPRNIYDFSTIFVWSTVALFALPLSQLQWDYVISAAEEMATSDPEQHMRKHIRQKNK